MKETQQWNHLSIDVFLAGLILGDLSGFKATLYTEGRFRGSAGRRQITENEELHGGKSKVSSVSPSSNLQAAKSWGSGHDWERSVRARWRGVESPHFFEEMLPRKFVEISSSVVSCTVLMSDNERSASNSWHLTLLSHCPASSVRECAPVSYCWLSTLHIIYNVFWCLLDIRMALSKVASWSMARIWTQAQNLTSGSLL